MSVMPVVFSREWFLLHQSKLLYLLNHKILSKAIREILLIDDLENSIILFLPNCYHIRIGKNEFVADFRTHNKWGKLMYHRWFYLWHLFHRWDRVINCLGFEKINLGFDTLTAYPDANTETTTFDGWLQKNGTSFSTVRNASSATTSADSTGTIAAGTDYGSSTYYVMRAILLFDTSSLTSSVLVSDASLSIKPSYLAQTTSPQSDLYIYTSNPASNTAIALADYAVSKFANQISTAISYTSQVVGYYSTKTLSNLAYINQVGVSKFGLRTNCDINTTTPTGTNSITAYSADTSGTASDPKLIITYSSASSKNNILMTP